MIYIENTIGRYFLCYVIVNVILVGIVILYVPGNRKVELDQTVGD